jgi:hypothetical protein
MKLPFTAILTFALLSLPFFVVKGQGTDHRPGPLNFFLDCEDCDFDYVRQELPFISFVRDPQLADIQILVTDSKTGGGGDKYYLNFIGLKNFKGTNFEYNVTTSQTDTEDHIRKELLKSFKIGILQYYAKNGSLDDVKIDINENGNKKAGPQLIDPWNKWVFRFDTGGEFQKEESQNAYSVKSEIRVEKTTEEWKTRIEAESEINRENYYDDDQLISDKQDSRNLTAYLIKSINAKWSAGFFGYYESQTYLNIKHDYGTSAGIEYNFFPWPESNRRIFSIRYNAGLNFINYTEQTIYEKMKETLLSESIYLNLILIQPWGEISVGLEGRHYFHDFSKSRLTLESDFSLRITKNFSVYFKLQSEIIHDQLYLPIGDASREDILLKRRKLATTYEINGDLGLRFTFGSIYNNIVNERFR